MIIDKDNIKILLFILILGLGIGYAYINSDLNINGTAQVNSANWDVHWANVQVKNGSVSASSPTISNQTTVNYSVVLNTPGDFYEFTVDAVNGGSIDAMIDTIDSKLNGATITTLPDYLNYTVTYSDGIELEQNHQLLHNTTEKYKVRIEYRTDINANQLPASNQSLNLQFTVTYRQANENAIQRLYYVYTYDYSPIGWDVGNIQHAYSDYTSVTNYLGYPAFIRHLVNDGTIEETYLGFIKNNKEYYLKAYSPSNYNSNRNYLIEIFGSNNCYDYDNGMACTFGEIKIGAYDSGSLGVLATDENLGALCIFATFSTNSGYAACNQLSN